VNDDFADQIRAFHENSLDLRSLKEVAERAYGKYLKSRQAASMESVKRARTMAKSEGQAAFGRHPLMMAAKSTENEEMEEEREDFLRKMKSFRPNAVIKSFSL